MEEGVLVMEYIDFSKRKPTNSEIISFFRMVFSDHQQAMEFEYTDKFNKMDDDEILAFYITNLKNRKKPNLGYWCSFNKKTIGMLGINRFSEEYRKHIGEIGFGIDERFQRQGICTELIKKAEIKAREYGVLRIECSCLDINIPALSLLEKLGYTNEGIRKKSILKNRKLHDQVLFGKIL